jgi:hypothetical protein
LLQAVRLPDKAVVCCKEKLSLSLDIAIAIKAVHRLILAGFERHLGVLAAGGAFYREHLVRLPDVVTAVPVVSGVEVGLSGFPGLPASRTTFRRMFMPL